MQIICQAFWIGFYLIMHVKAMKTVDYDLIYFLTGESLTLSCNYKVSFWNGPAVTDMDNMTSPVTITDTSGNLKVLNVSIYMHGGTLASTLPKKRFNRLKIVGDNFDLRITNLSTFDEGLYICEPKEKRGLPPSQYYLQNILFPSELNILNVTQVNTVNGKEHTQMHLVCSVKSGKPLEELRWKKNRTIIRHGGPGKLVYSFVPKTTDHNSVYTCEAQNSYMAIPLSKSIHLNIKYKPFVNINVSSTLTVIQGEFAQICCISMSNPKPTSISWHKSDKELDSAFSNNSLFYKMSNVSRYETGNYTCSSKNEIGNASSGISLTVLYPPVIKIRYSNLTEHRRDRTIQCLPGGEPKSYKFFKWEHQSFFNEHIRYLRGTDDGILRLPAINASNIYQDTGIYICNVSNGIPDYREKKFQLGRAYYLVSIGPPIITADNKRIQKGYKESAVKIKINVYSPLEIICHNITEVDGMSVRQQDMKVRMEPILIKENFHNAIVTVNGTEIFFILHGLSSSESHELNVTVCNSYGQSSFIVHSEPFVKSSDENSLTSQDIINIVLSIIILVLITGIGVYIRYTKHRYRKRVITEINIQTDEQNVAASPHYAEILEDSMLTPPQENNTQFISETDRIVPGNSNTTALSDNYSSSSSNTDNNASDDLNDGYEKPYTTLVSNNADEIEHVYRKTKQTLTYENATAFTNATLGHSVELQRFLLDITETNCNSNEDRANTDMHYEENNPQEIDDDSNRSNSYKQKETVEYINLSLKQ